MSRVSTLSLSPTTPLYLSHGHISRFEMHAASPRSGHVVGLGPAVFHVPQDTIEPGAASSVQRFPVADPARFHEPIPPPQWSRGLYFSPADSFAERQTTDLMRAVAADQHAAEMRMARLRSTFGGAAEAKEYAWRRQAESELLAAKRAARIAVEARARQAAEQAQEAEEACKDLVESAVDHAVHAAEQVMAESRREEKLLRSLRQLESEFMNHHQAQDTTRTVEKPNLSRKYLLGLLDAGYLHAAVERSFETP